MRELLDNLLEDKDIFKPHSEEGIDKLKQEWDSLNDLDQMTKLSHVLSSIKVVPHTYVKLFKQAGYDRILRKRFYFDAISRKK